MLKKISVYNFKTLHKLENVHLDKITLIGGKNNAGKSTLLEAAFMYLDRKNGNLLNRQLMWRGLANLQMNISALWEPFFYDFDLSKNISIEVTEVTENKTKTGRLGISYQKNYNPKLTLPLIVTDNVQIQSISNEVSGSLLIKYETENSVDFKGRLLLNARGINYLIEKESLTAVSTAVFFSARRFSDNQDADRLGILDIDDTQNKILDILRIFEPRLKKLLVVKSGLMYVIYADIGNQKKIPINLLGDGFCRCLSMILILATNTNGVLFLDEIENGIHYSVLNIFWEAIIKAVRFYNCQLVATTHSYEMIKSLGEVCKSQKFNNISYIRLAKQENEVLAHQFNADDLSFALSSELEMR